jgi:phosphate transport system protein
MRGSFHHELEELRLDITRMGTMVEQALARSVQSLKESDVAAARQVVADDAEINRQHLAIEARCLSLLALQQPMAKDLRVIGTALKMITDLERMADYAVNIAKTTVRLEGEPLIKPLVDIPRMVETTMQMLRDAVQAFVNEDVDLALRMIERDHEVDHLYKRVFEELEELMKKDPANVHQALQLLFVARSLERTADHATNLGEWTIYMVTGERKELNL